MRPFSVRHAMALLAFPVLCAVVAPSPASAARFVVIHPKGQEAVNILIQGRIDVDDGQRFLALLMRLRRENRPVALVSLDSPGGYVSEGLSIAAVVRRERLDTYVADLCASSCFNVFAAGANRLASRQASIGVHMAYTRRGPSREGTAAMADYAVLCGTPGRVIAKMRATAAPRIAWLDGEDMHAMHVRLTP
jgi:hypothetical protein